MKGNFKLAEALKEAGAQEIVEGSSRCRFQIEKNGKPWNLEVEWEHATILPRFYLGKEHCTHHRPHVNWERNVCYSDGEGLFFDHEHPEAVLKTGLDLAIKVLEDGENCDLNPFWDEQEAFFNLTGAEAIRGTADCYFDLDETPRKLKSFKKSGKFRTYKFFEDKTQCWDLHLSDYRDAQLGKGNRPQKGQKQRKQKAKRPQCHSPAAYYLPLDQPVEPPLPGEAWTAEKALRLVEPFSADFPELTTYLKKNHQLYIFSIPRAGNARGAFAVEVNPKKSASVHVFHLSIARHTKKYMQKRGSVPDSFQMNTQKIAIIGCGSVGGYMANMLAQSGFDQFTLVDHDAFLPENIYRHILPRRYIGKNKASALKHFLENSFPQMTVKDVPDQVQSWAVKQNLEEHEILILATGNPALERYLNQSFRSVARDDQVLMSIWLEPLGLGGHVLLHAANSKGCLNCLYTRENELISHPVVSFIEPGQKVSRNLTGCGGAFTPFSSLDAQTTAILAVRTLETYCSAPRTSNYACWFGNSTVAKQNDIATSVVFNSNFAEKDVWWSQQLRYGCPICNARGL